MDNSNKTKHLLVENELKKLQALNSSYFRGKNYFVADDGTKKYLAFHPMKKYFKKIDNTDYISEWKPKGLSNEVIIPPGIFWY